MLIIFAAIIGLIMEKQSFDTFKQSQKDWKNTHQDKYDLFEEEMNSKNAIGYQKIMNLAITLVPAYKKLINQKANQGAFDGIADIENLFTENKLAQTIEEVKKPTKVEYRHRHTIDIGSSKVFLSLVAMALLILGLCYVVGAQRRSISQYKENDLKYRYIKMQGQTNEESIYRLEQQFQYSDSIKIIRKQVEKYEELVREQAERIKRAQFNESEAKRLEKQVESIKGKK
jgi:hypothetical protein